MSDDKNIANDEGVCNAYLTNHDMENDEVEYSDGEIYEKGKECTDVHMSITDNSVKGFFIESTSTAEVDGVNANFVDESEFLDDSKNVVGTEHMNVDGTEEIETEHKCEASGFPSLWSLCSEKLKILYKGDIAKVRCVFEYVKNLYKDHIMNADESTQSGIFDILICKKTENDQEAEMASGNNSQEANVVEPNPGITKGFQVTPDNESTDSGQTEKVIGTVCQVSNGSTCAVENEKESGSKISKSDKLDVSARSSTSFDSDKESSESGSSSDYEGNNCSTSPVTAVGSPCKAEVNDGNVAIVQSKKALRNIETKMDERRVGNEDTSCVVKVEDTIECSDSEGTTDDAKGKK